MTFVLLAAVVIVAAWPARHPAIRRQSDRRSVAKHQPAPGSGLVSVLAADGALLGMAFGLVVGSPLLVVVSPIAVVGVWREYIRRRRRRRLNDRAEAMLVFTEAAVAGLRAGGSLSTAVADALGTGRTEPESSSPSSRAARPTSHRHPALGQAGAGLAAGRTLGAAFSDSFAGPGVSSDDRLVATTIVALHGSGAAAVDGLERVVDTLRARRSWQEDLRTQAQHALSSAGVMSVLPVIFGTVVALADPDVAEFYRARWLGAFCAGSALLLLLAGREWQHHLLAVR